MINRIGKYEIKRPLGEGAYSSVCVAADTFAQRDVALNVMNPPPPDAKAALAGKLRQQPRRRAGRPGGDHAGIGRRLARRTCRPSRSWPSA